MQLAQETLSGWGNIPKSTCNVLYPRNEHDLLKPPAARHILPRGLGRSYADQATNTDQVVLKMEKMNHFLSFDEEKGILHCEAGVSLEDILTHLTPRGWFPMITPGTKYVTIGGAIANDVHGKAHHADGSFVNCVYDFTILLADGSVVRASREENPDLFWANFGGLGLLGTILTATIQLRKVETTYFRQKAFAARNLDEMLQAIDETSDEFPASVAWIDPMAKGERLGRGVLSMGDHARFDELPEKLKKDPLKIGGKPKLTVPFYLPAFVLNPLTVRMLDMVIYQMQKSAPSFSHYDKFFYPLDMINEWNRGYGKRGFIQYQFVIPVKRKVEKKASKKRANTREERVEEMKEVVTKMGPMKYSTTTIDLTSPANASQIAIITKDSCFRPDIYLNNGRHCAGCRIYEFCACSLKRLKK